MISYDEKDDENDLVSIFEKPTKRLYFDNTISLDVQHILTYIGRLYAKDNV